MKKTKLLKSFILGLSVLAFSSGIPAISSKASDGTAISSESTDKPAAESSAEPKVTAEAALAIDYDTGEIIYCKNADNRMYPASTTKMLTALLLAENSQKTDMLTYTEDAIKQEPTALRDYMPNIAVGDKMTADDVMKGFMLHSSNDAAYMIADAVSGNPEKFAELMNKRAKELGAEHSHFVTPNGLDSFTDDHYVTAYDLSLITKAVYENNWTREVMATQTALIDLNGTKYEIPNSNKLLGVDGCVGGKTGYTDKAGGCLATIYDRNGRKIICIVLKSKYQYGDAAYRFDDTAAIANYSYSVPKTVYKSAGETITTAKLSYKPFFFIGPEKTIEVPVTANEDIKYYKNSINDAESQVNLDDNTKDAWKTAKDPNVKLNYTVRGYSQPVSGTVSITAGELLKINMFSYILVAAAIAVVIAIAVLLLKTNTAKPKKKPKHHKKKAA